LEETTMKITNLTLILATALAFTACKGDKDSGDSADSGTGGDGTTDGTDGGDGGGDTVESCDWDGLGLCFEFTNQSGVEAWCSDIGTTYSISTSYAANGCDAATKGTCDGITGGDFGSLTATAYYYDEFSNDAEAACSDAGGTYAG
jgi:hypothetical protein